MQDARRKGRMKLYPVWKDETARAKAQLTRPRGADVPNSKLTDEQVSQMRRQRVAGKSLPWLAKAYKLDVSTVDGICKGETWRHIFDRPDCPPLGVMLAVKGNTKSNARLTEDQVREIKKLLAAGVMGKDIAAQFGVHKATISDIRCGKVWREVS